MPLAEITVHQRGEIVILDPSGRILLSEGDPLMQLVTERLDRGFLKYLLNMHRAPYIDSAGLGDIVRTHLLVTRRRGRFKICSIAPRIQAVLDVQRLTPVLDLFDSEESAVHSFEEGVSIVR